jgi:hypothetical protein
MWRDGLVSSEEFAELFGDAFLHLSASDNNVGPEK